jgi:hypothetical protein
MVCVCCHGCGFDHWRCRNRLAGFGQKEGSRYGHGLIDYLHKAEQVDEVRGMGNYQHIGLDAGLPTLSVITLLYLLYLYLSGGAIFSCRL